MIDRLRRAVIDADSVRSLALIDPTTLQAYDPANAPVAIHSMPVQALGVPSVYAAVRMISRDVASMPWAAYNRGTAQLVAEQPTVLRRPDPFEPVDGTRMKLASALLLRGNAFAWLTAPGRDGRPTVAIPIPNGEVFVTWNERRTRPVYRWRGEVLELGRTIAHFKYLDLGPEYLLGLGPIQACSTSLAGALGAERFAEQFYGDSGVPDGVLTAPGALTKPEADLLRNQWAEARAGARSTAVLPQGVTWEAITVNNADAQYIEGRQFSALSVAQMFGIPAGKLGAQQSGSSLTYTNLESLQSQYATDAVKPVSEELESVFGELIPSTQEVRFSFMHLIRADTPTRFSVYEKALTNGILTLNEVRELEGRPPLEGGDTPRDPTPTTTDTDTTEPAEATT